MSEIWLREAEERDCKEHGLVQSSKDELKQYCKGRDCYFSCWGDEEDEQLFTKRKGVT